MSLKDLIKTLKSDKILAPKIDQHLLGKQRSGVGDGWIHPSQITQCIRKQVLNCLKYPYTDQINPRLRRIFDNGDHMHSRYQTYLRDMGALKLCEACNGKGGNCRACRGSGVEHGFELTDLLVRGHTDGIFLNGFLNHFDDAILELKSMRSEQFALLGGPKHDHLLQSHIYMRGFEKKRTIFIYENKNDQLMKEYVVIWDSDIWHTALAIIKKIVGYVTYQKIPAGICEPEKLSAECSYRDACEQCWREGKWEKS